MSTLAYIINIMRTYKHTQTLTHHTHTHNNNNNNNDNNEEYQYTINVRRNGLTNNGLTNNGLTNAYSCLPPPRNTPQLTYTHNTKILT